MQTQKGCGVGLRPQHYPTILETWPKVDWFEAVSENYMDTGGRPLHTLERIRARYPIALHGTALSIGSADAVNKKYLKSLKTLADRIDPFIVSDHLCWSGFGSQALHDLLPLPYTEEALDPIVDHVLEVQDFLKRKFYLENISTYVTYTDSTMTEWEFLSEVSRRSGCGLLLDINNVYVNSINHGFDPMDYLRGISGERVGQIHLAGHTDMGDFLFDTHSAPVLEKVWELYEKALERWGAVSTLIEWDEHIPAFDRLFSEAQRAKTIYSRYEHTGRASGGLRPAGMARHSGASSRVLKETQESMKAYIQALGTSEQVSGGRHWTARQGADLKKRLEVYRIGFVARIQEALAEVYEAVRAVLGDTRFYTLARQCAQKSVPAEYNLNAAGQHLARFIDSSTDLKEFPFLSDLARLEWGIWEAFHAYDEAPLTPQALQAMGGDLTQAQLIFQPSVRLIDSEWPVLDIWDQRRRSPDSVAVKEGQAQSVLISRQNDEVQCQPLDSAERMLLSSLLEGFSLDRACERLAESVDAQDLPIGQWFAGWMQRGLIRDIKFSSNASNMAE